MTTDSGLQLMQGARYWRRNPDMWWRKGKWRGDPALAEAQATSEETLAIAEHQRDRERYKLREETRTVTEPLRLARRANHLAESAIRALRGGGW